MKIGIVSDVHFGFGQGSEREPDALFQAKQALEGILEQKPDFVLMAGDLYDGNEPSPEAWKQSFEFFGLAKKMKNNLELTRENRDRKKEKIEWDSLVVVSIHGTHEYRPKGFVNALDVLEQSRFLVHLHAQKLFLKKGGETVVISGLSGVPEKVSKDVLKQWNPRPEPGCHNIFVLHQSIKEFLPTDDDMAATISLSDLPAGFDLLVNGHLHWPTVHDTPQGRFLLTGSTLATQIKRLETLKPKGYWMYDTLTGALDFFAIPIQRKMFYKKIRFENAGKEEVKKQIDEFYHSIFSPDSNFEMKPLARIKLGGTLQAGLEPKDLPLREWLSLLEEKTLLSWDENFSAGSLRQRIAQLRALQKDKQSVASQGLSLLEMELSKTGFDNAFSVREVFDLLAEDETERAMELVLQKKEVK